MTGRPIVHARDHWASGADPAATAWYVAGEGTNPALESPWTGTLRWRFDGNGDLELDGDITGGTFTDTVIFLPGQFWPAVTRTRPGWLTSDDALVATTVSSVDGEVTISEVTVTGGGGGTVAIADGGTGASTASGARTNLGLAIGSNVQAYDADLTTYASITPSTNVQSLLGAANYAAMRTLLSLVIGTNAQAWDADLDAIAALSASNDDVIQRKAGAWTNRTLAQLIADLAALGTTFQPLDSDLTAFAGLSIAADKLPYGTGSHTLGLTDLTSFIRTLLDDTDAATARSTLGISAANTPFTPAGTISATDVQAAIVEAAAEAGSGSAQTTQFVQAGQMIPAGTGGASGPTGSDLGASDVNVETMDFADGSDLYAHFRLKMPDDWAAGTFTYRVWWYAAGTGTDSVVFGLEARAAGDGDAIDGSWGAQVTVTDNHTSTANTEQVTDESAALAASNTPAAGDVVYFRLQRLASSDALAQTVKVVGVEVDWTGDGVAAMPSYIASGTAATPVAASPGDISVPYSASIAAGDFLLSQIVSRSGAGTLDTVPAGWTLLVTSPTQPDAQSSTIQQWLYYKFASGSETGSETWSVSNTSLFMGVQHTFGGVDAAIFEGGGTTGGTTATVAHSSITSTGPNRLGVIIGCISNDYAMTEFSGETGGDFTEALAEFTTTVGSDGTMFLQIAPMVAATTISGGTVTISASGDANVSRSFALLPVGA